MYSVQEWCTGNLYGNVEGAVPMFMVISIPWPVPSANAALIGHVPAPGQAARASARRRGWLRPALAGAARTR